MAEQKSIDIAIRAQNLAGAGLKDAERSVAGSVNNMNKALQQGFQIGGILAAVNAASQGLDVLTAAMSGDLEKMADEAARLPLGIGAAFSVGQKLREMFTGERAEIEAIEARITLMNMAIDTGAQLWKIQQDAVAQLGDIMGSAEDRMKLMGLEGAELEIERARQAHEKYQASIEETAKAQKDAFDATQGKAIRELNEQLSKQRELKEEHSTGWLTDAEGAAAAEKEINSINAQLDLFAKRRVEAFNEIDLSLKGAGEAGHKEFAMQQQEIEKKSAEDQKQKQDKIDKEQDKLNKESTKDADLEAMPQVGVAESSVGETGQGVRGADRGVSTFELSRNFIGAAAFRAGQSQIDPQKQSVNLLTKLVSLATNAEKHAKEQARAAARVQGFDVVNISVN